MSQAISSQTSKVSPLETTPSVDAGDLWTQFHAELAKFLRARVSSEALCDDILQNAFLRAHSRLDQGIQLTQPRAWLYQIVRNLMLDVFRAQNRSKALRQSIEAEVSSLDTYVEPSPCNWDDSEVFQAVARVLPLFINNLDPPYRQALQLTELEGLSQKEAAQQAGVTTTCMKSRVNRARRQVHAALQHCCTFQLDGRGRMMDCERRDGEPCCPGG